MNAREQAQVGLNLLKEAILEVLGETSEGLSNAQIADLLGLRSNYLGKHEGYLGWSLLGLLLNDGAIRKDGKRYYVAEMSEALKKTSESPDWTPPLKNS